MNNIEFTTNKNSGGVYLISKSNSELLKIGKTRDFSRRVKEIESSSRHVGNLDSFHIERMVSCDNKNNLERAFHIHFKNKRKMGEWFDITMDEFDDFINNKEYTKYDIDNKPKEHQVSNLPIGMMFRRGSYILLEDGNFFNGDTIGDIETYVENNEYYCSFSFINAVLERQSFIRDDINSSYIRFKFIDEDFDENTDLFKERMFKLVGSEVFLNVKLALLIVCNECSMWAYSEEGLFENFTLPIINTLNGLYDDCNSIVDLFKDMVDVYYKLDIEGASM